MKRINLMAIFIIITILAGCAGREVEVARTDKITKDQNVIFVYPLRNASYKGRELHGVGRDFSAVFVSEIVATGRNSRLIETEDFKDTFTVDVEKACSYAKEHGADVAIIGSVDEWLDGATQWSGKVDVVSVTVYAYSTGTCSLITSASGREQGQWFTFVNAPATRFYKPLSQELINTIFE